MRVGLIIYGSLETISGGYLYDRQLVATLRQAGDTVEVIGLPWRTYGQHLLDNYSPGLRRRLAAPVDLWLQDELNHPSLWWLNRHLRRQHGRPIVAIVHHLRVSEARQPWQNRLYRWVEQRYLASVDAFVFNSQTTRRAVAALVGNNRPAIVAPPAGDRLGGLFAVPPPARSVPRSDPLPPLRLIFIGNLIARKGLHTLLEALARLDPAIATLTVIGSQTVDPPYVRRLNRQISAAGLTQRVTLHGALPDADLANHLVNSDLLVVPSSYEGFGIVYLEAMAFGLPVIATTAGGAAEVVAHGVNGLLIEPDDVAGLVAHLHLLHADRQRLQAMAVAARQRYQAHPTWTATTAAIRAFLVELCP